jgi:uncharacterized membrane protein
MSRRVDQKQLVAAREVVAPPAPRACTDRDFGLPPVLHIATAALFLGFVTVLCLAFATPGLLVPNAVFAFFIVAFFAVPAMWARMKPESRTKALSWYEFREKGIDTMTGRTPAGEAATLVLVLPTLVFLWAVGIALISVAVR